MDYHKHGLKVPTLDQADQKAGEARKKGPVSPQRNRSDAILASFLGFLTALAWTVQWAMRFFRPAGHHDPRGRLRAARVVGGRRLPAPRRRGARQGRPRHRPHLGDKEVLEGCDKINEDSGNEPNAACQNMQSEQHNNRAQCQFLQPCT